MGATLKIWNTYIAPATNALLDLGSDALEFKDLWIDGAAYIDLLGRNLLVDTSFQIQFRDTAIHIESASDGHLDLTADTTIDMNGVVLATDKVAFTQTDLLEYIDSLNDGYLDIASTTQTRFRISAVNQIYLADGGLIPTTNNDIDLGTTGNRYKDVYWAGSVYGTIDGGAA